MLRTRVVNGITWDSTSRDDLVLREFVESRHWFGFHPLVTHDRVRPEWMAAPPVQFGLRTTSRLSDGREVRMHFDPRVDIYQGKTVVIEAPPLTQQREIVVTYERTHRPHPAWGGKS